MFHQNDAISISHTIQILILILILIQIQIQVQNQTHLLRFDSTDHCPETRSVSDSIPQSLPPFSQNQKPADAAHCTPSSPCSAFYSSETIPFPKSSSFHRSDLLLPPLPVHSGQYDPDSPFPRIHAARSSTTIQCSSLSNAVIPNRVVRLQQRQQLHFAQDFLMLLPVVFQIDLLNLRHTSLSIPTAYFIPSSRCVHSVIRPNPPCPISFITTKSVLNRPIADYKTSRSRNFTVFPLVNSSDIISGLCSSILFGGEKEWEGF